MDNSKRQKQIYQATLSGSFANAFLVVLKYIAGFMGNSTAMIADATHSLSDFATDIVVILFIRLSGRPKDSDHAYGHGKFETLATAIIGFVLILVGAGIFWESANKIYDYSNGIPIKQPEMLALYAALISIVVKELLFWYTRHIGKTVKSDLVIANAWHHRSDALSSIGTTIGIGGAIVFGEKWAILDPIAAIIVSFFILKVAIKLMTPSMNDLLEKSLPADIRDQILKTVAETPGVSDPHNLRTRRIGTDFAIEVHVRVEPMMTVKEAHYINTEIENKLRRKYGSGTHIAIHTEPFKPEIDMNL